MAPSEEQIAAWIQNAQTADLLRRGYKVQAQARKHLGGTPGHPKRVDTGDLRSSVQVQPKIFNGAPAVRIGSNRKHARWVHDGTGLFGPHHQRIFPTQAKALVFPSKKFGKKKGKFAGKVVVRSTRGMQRNQFLKDALSAARD